MLLTDTKSVIKFLDIEILEEIASEFVRDTSKKQKQYPIVEQIKEYWFDEAEEELGNATAIQLLEVIDFQAIADQFEEEAQEIVAMEINQAQKDTEALVNEATQQLNTQKEKALLALEEQVNTLSEQIKNKLLSGKLTA